MLEAPVPHDWTGWFCDGEQFDPAKHGWRAGLTCGPGAKIPTRESGLMIVVLGGRERGKHGIMPRPTPEDAKRTKEQRREWFRKNIMGGGVLEYPAGAVKVAEDLSRKKCPPPPSEEELRAREAATVAWWDRFVAEVGPFPEGKPIWEQAGITREEWDEFRRKCDQLRGKSRDEQIAELKAHWATIECQRAGVFDSVRSDEADAPIVVGPG